jgi:hypothetical protein
MFKKMFYPNDTQMNPFEFWFFSGLVTALFSIIAYFIVRYIRSQDKKNDIYFSVIAELKDAVTELNITLKLTDKLYEERHENHEKRITNLEKRQK